MDETQRGGCKGRVVPLELGAQVREGQVAGPTGRSGRRVGTPVRRGNRGRLCRDHDSPRLCGPKVRAR